MGYDWGRLQREDDARSIQNGLALGASWVGIAVVGVVLNLVGVIDDWGTTALWLVLGAVPLVGSLVLRRRRRREPADEDEPADTTP